MGATTSTSPCVHGARTGTHIIAVSFANRFSLQHRSRFSTVRLASAVFVLIQASVSPPQHATPRRRKPSTHSILHALHAVYTRAELEEDEPAASPAHQLQKTYHTHARLHVFTHL